MRQLPGGVVTVEDFLTAGECRELIVFSEMKGYEEAGVDTGAGQKVIKSVRNNDRIFFDDETLAQRLFQKVAPYVPESVGLWGSPCGLNERFRFYRYEDQQFFDWHFDGPFVRSETERSVYTFMVYLNDGFTGGQTVFTDYSVQPEVGMALLFPHRTYHQGSEVTSGQKYVLRSDVMYRSAV